MTSLGAGSQAHQNYTKAKRSYPMRPAKGACVSYWTYIQECRPTKSAVTATIEAIPTKSFKRCTIILLFSFYDKGHIRWLQYSAYRRLLHRGFAPVAWLANHALTVKMDRQGRADHT